jgi:hypothetical protein
MATTELAVAAIADPNPPASKPSRDGDQPSHQTPELNSSKNSNGSPPSARNTKVLLLSWLEDRDCTGAPDMSWTLGTTLKENFGFDPVTFKIPPQNPTRAVLKEIYSCRDSLPNPDDLLIISYIGHGSLAARGTLELFPYQ